MLILIYLQSMLSTAPHLGSGGICHEGMAVQVHAHGIFISDDKDRWKGKASSHQASACEAGSSANHLEDKHGVQIIIIMRGRAIEGPAYARTRRDGRPL